MASTPKELIQSRLDEWLRAKEKSDKSYEKGEINAWTHDQHTANLEPLIEMYSQAMKVLNKYT
jgi:hypothetical protein